MNIFKKLFSRPVLIALVAVLEIFFVGSVFLFFHSLAAWIETILRILSVIIVITIINNSKHLSQDIIWIVLIVLSPIFGTTLYLFTGADLFMSKTFRNILIETQKAKKYYHQDKEVLKELEDDAPYIRGQFHYMSSSAGFPAYRNQGFDYYPLGDEGFPVILEELKKAKEFIFMEYFIIEEGKMWNEILKILEEKAKEGVEVRVMYDDVGSLMTLSYDYARRLEEKGIQCVSFNRVDPILNIILNHRDHRKILVIDGKTAFSGGVNLADEYINVKEKHGHWKDNVIRVKGEAVWSYTVLFLTNWNALRHQDEDYRKFRRYPEETAERGYIVPYGETPLDNEITSQNIYMNILNQANDYVYIMTPYLIIDTEFINALILAAKRGVDVRIITPGIPDKKIVFYVTRSFYGRLIEGGVKICEYDPGFVHGKVFVSDDRIAAVGTINLDYRSLYLHFENGTYLYDVKEIEDIRKDLEETMEKGHEVSPSEVDSHLWYKLFVGFIKLFAPLM